MDCEERADRNLRRWYQRQIRELDLDLEVPLVNHRRGQPSDSRMGFGAIVAVARFGGVVLSERECRARVGEAGARFWIGPVGLILEDVVELREPVKAPGKLSLWTLDEETVDAVRRQFVRRKGLPSGLLEELLRW